MKDAAPAYLMRALGSLPVKRKVEFLKDALRALHRFQDSHAVRRPIPPREDRVALARVGTQTARLIQALKSAEASESGTMLLKDAWLTVGHDSGEKAGSPLPALERLQQAVALCLPEKKRAALPLEKSRASSQAIVTLAHHFHNHFGRLPTFAAGSPFVSFIREALPAHGLYVPSLVEIRRIAAGA